jgi:hypothetical protein
MSQATATTRSEARLAGEALEERFKALLGGYGTTARLSRATGIHQSHLHRIWAGLRPIPDMLFVVVEFLEALPPEQWPARWRR